MRILIHDYGRYAFTADLARQLAVGGHDVGYAFSSLDTARSELPVVDRLTLFPLQGADELSKGSFIRRYQAEVGHGLVASNAIRSYRPEVILSANTPLDAQRQMLKAARETNSAFVYWVQDILSLAMKKILSRKLPVVGGLIASRYNHLEGALLRKSNSVIAISDEFRIISENWGVSADRISVIENWAPKLRQVTDQEVSEWKAANGLTGKKLIIYSGTIGMKHSPEVALDLARRLSDTPEAAVVVIGEGQGVEWLRMHIEETIRGSLVLLPFQPTETMPVALASATALLVLLDKEAGSYCVPSKIWTYMRAGKPIIAAMPGINPGSRRIKETQSGIAVETEDLEGLVAGAKMILSNPELALAMGRSAEDFADMTFDPDRLTKLFEEALQKAIEQ